jgi:hypothetical protein
VKHFCNTRNVIPNIQKIKIINAFCDGVTDIQTIEEITMKKPKVMANLLAIADECIEASEVQAPLLDACKRAPQRRRSRRIRRSM